MTINTKSVGEWHYICADLPGSAVPLVKTGNIYAAVEFVRQARCWHSWDWLIKLVHADPVDWATLMQEISDFAKVCQGLHPVSIKDVLSAGLPEQVELDEEVRAVVADFFANPSHRVPVAVGPDDFDLEDPDEAEVIAGLVTEYVSADFTERQWSASSEVLPHRRVPENAIVVDYDCVAADLDFEAARLPEPTKVLTNPENGHAHLWWLVAGEFASSKARRWMRDIQRGYTRRLSGDLAYAMVYTKNPDYPGWQVDGSGALYSLRQLDAVLSPAEKFRDWSNTSPDLDGRNVALFNKLRFHAYQGDYASEADCVSNLMEVAGQFEFMGLSHGEVLTLCRSIARYVLAGHGPEWVRSGLKRRTWYDKKSVIRGSHGGSRVGSGRKSSVNTLSVQPEKHELADAHKRQHGGHNKSYTDKQVADVLSCKNLGWSNRKIAAEIGLSEPTVRRILHRVE
jgi:Replicase family/Homeodomain-like domain